MNLIALEHKLKFTGDPSIVLEWQQDIAFYTYSKFTVQKKSVTFTEVNDTTS